MWFLYTTACLHIVPKRQNNKKYQKVQPSKIDDSIDPSAEMRSPEISESSAYRVACGGGQAPVPESLLLLDKLPIPNLPVPPHSLALP